MEAVIDVTLPRARESVPRVRRIVESTAKALAGGQRIDDLVLAMSELCTNVIQHAAGEEFRIRLEIRSGTARVRIDDEGTRDPDPTAGPNGEPHAMPPSTSLRGRGLAIVDTLVDELRIHEQSDGVWTVVLEHDLYASPFAASA